MKVAVNRIAATIERNGKMRSSGSNLRTLALAFIIFQLLESLDMNALLLRIECLQPADVVLHTFDYGSGWRFFDGCICGRRRTRRPTAPSLPFLQGTCPGKEASRVIGKGSRIRIAGDKEDDCHAVREGGSRQ
jgi:hypothetical protein